MVQPVSFQDVSDGLSKRWAGHRSTPICFQLLSYVQRIGVKNAKYLSMERLASVAGRRIIDEEFLVALNILSVSSPPLLSVAAILHFEDEEYDLDTDEVDLVLGEDTAIHPITGEIIHNASEHTEIYYTVHEGMLDVE